MKFFFLTLSLSFFFFTALAQDYAIISSKDSILLVREKPEDKSKIAGRFGNNDLFCFDDRATNKTDWIKVYRYNQTQPGGNTEIEGYVQRNLIKHISDLTTLSKTKVTDSQALIKNDSISVSVATKRFIPRKHKLTFQVYAPGQTKVNKIDGRPFWGTDGNLPNDLPKNSISSVKITIREHLVLIPKKAYNDLYEPSFRAFKVYLGNKNTIYIRMDNSDGAGSYTVIWIIKNHKYLKRFIDNSEA